MPDPTDHHYLPIFYLSRWLGSDDQVCRFSRPYGNKVVSKRVSPKGTAYEEHLYSIRREKGPPLPDMETDFMSKLDSEAAIALEHLEDGLPESEWDARFRSAWSRFIWSQSIRTPSEISQLKSSVKQAWSASIPDLQKRYAEMRSDDMPSSVHEYLASVDPYEEDRFALRIARTLMDHSKIGQVVNNMHWQVLNFEGCGIPLMTSDRPVWMTTTFSEADAFMMMPIGPNRLFVATRDVETRERLGAQKRKSQAKNVNKLMVQHALKYVFAVDDKMSDFVAKHFATKRHSTHMERLAKKHGHTIVSKYSPAANR